jgi:hypothetical protein
MDFDRMRIFRTGLALHGNGQPASGRGNLAGRGT